MDMPSVWLAPPSVLGLEAGEIHIWRIKLAEPDAAIIHCYSLLSPDERIRANRFHFPRDRNRYVIARSMLRRVLGRYLSLDPKRLQFIYGEMGKPEVEQKPNSRHLRFNLSHSGEFALIALSWNLSVGIDVERVNHQLATEQIAERFFSLRERAILRMIPSGQKAQAFFSCWTRKEAYLKALGKGLSVSLDSFDIECAPGLDPALLRPAPEDCEGACWRIFVLNPAVGYVGALSAEGRNHSLQYIDPTAAK